MKFIFTSFIICISLFGITQTKNKTSFGLNVESGYSRFYHISNGNASPSYPITPNILTTNLGGNNLSFSLNPQVKFKDKWLLSLNFGCSFSSQKQRSHIVFDEENLIFVDMKHSINLWNTGFTFGRLIHINSKNTISIELGASYIGFLSKAMNNNEIETKEFFGTTINEYDEESNRFFPRDINGYMHYNYYAKNFYTPLLLKIGYQTPLWNNEFGFKIIWMPIAINFYTDHRFVLDDKTVLYTSNFASGSIGFSLSYTLCFKKSEK